MNKIALFCSLAACALALSAEAAPGAQVQTCADVPPIAAGSPLSACKAIVGGPTFNTDLVLTYIEPAHVQQVWAPWNTLATNKSVCVIQPAGPCRWTSRGNVSALGVNPPAAPPAPPVLSPPVVSPTVPPPVIAPTVDYTVISGYRIELSYDAGKSWDPIETTLTYPSQALAHCFRITAVRADGLGPTLVSCPLPK